MRQTPKKMAQSQIRNHWKVTPDELNIHMKAQMQMREPATRSRIGDRLCMSQVQVVRPPALWTVAIAREMAGKVARSGRGLVYLGHE